MNRIAIEDIKNIVVNCPKSMSDIAKGLSIGSSTDIDIEDHRGSIIRVELTTDHARYLAEETYKKVFDRSEQPETLWERIHELEAVNLVLEDKLKRLMGEGGNQKDG